MTDPNDIDPATANWLAAKLDPGAFPAGDGFKDSTRRNKAKRLARVALAELWDAGWLIEDPRKKET